MNILLFINGNLGIRILDYISNLGICKLTGVILNSDNKRGPDYFDEVECQLRARNVEVPILKWNQGVSQSAELQSLLNGAEFGVSALFGHILPEEVIGKFPGGIINLHPSLLPIGRGADPIPWGIIEGQKQGITLHLIDSNLDSGSILYQKEIPADISMNAGEIYEIAMSELFTEFSRLFKKWIDGEIQVRPQINATVTQHKSCELVALRVIKDYEIASFGEFIRRIQATSFSNGSLPTYFDDKGSIWEIAIKIMKPSNNE